MKIQGTIESISDIKRVTEKFSKREMVIVTDDLYPQTLMTEWPNESASIPEKYSAGDVVEVSINIRGRKWESPSGEVKYFTSLNGWAVSLVANGGQMNAPAPKAQGNIERRFEDDAINSMTEDDDLPF